ncbi:MAG: hypothetical protein Q7U98_18105 [Methylicorpusculum sp.]|uniref:hypothetical protein n=1 Tax=Methylicorpusculum sp. TaxID=2713644 RepID=UPI002725F6FF|nr:hypothetical protein [Methylicorpusculum sp.]MDO8941071.1 hypothetical protein [Methylicorpusculum sp.]MDP2202330.1 hypothetical protein [Methylicorpusculum sp.]
MLYKLDGKQRQTVWLSGKSTPPEYLMAQIIELAEADFNALNAEVEQCHWETLSPHERVKATYQSLGLNFRSERLRGGFIVEALDIALRGRPRALQDKRLAAERQELNLKKAISLLSPELMLIENLNPKSPIFVTGVLAGALIMLGINKKTEEFFTKLNNQQGQVKEGFEDPVEGLARAIIQSQRDGPLAMHAQLSIELCKKTIQAIGLWEEGVDSSKYWRKRALCGVDHMPYIRELKRLKLINDQRDL